MSASTMRNFSTLGTSRRQRQRQALWHLLRIGAVVGFVGAVAVAAFETGVAQNAARVDNLEADLAVLADSAQAARAAAAAAEEQAKAATERAFAIADRYKRDVPQGERADLLRLIDQKRAEGLSVERLIFVVEVAREAQVCEEEVETKRFILPTPVAVTRDGSVSFGENRITVTGQGTPSRDDEGRPQGWFDVAEPVQIRFLKLDGEVTFADGLLPLVHRLVDGEREWRFQIRARDERGMVEITGEACAYP